MTDVKSGLNQLFLRDEELRQGIELLFFAYRISPLSPTRFWPNGTSAGPIIG